MQYLEEFIDTDDQHEIPVRIWLPKHANKVLLIVHGMAEYCERYAPMADWLTKHNIAVVAYNHRGHGMDCPETDLGYFADHFGWQLLQEDLHRVVEFTRTEIPDVPITLFGHSMGSFLCQNYIQHHSDSIEQLILSASNRVQKPKIAVSLMLVSFIKFFKGKRATSKLVNYLALDSMNTYFKPNKTKVDWLSRDHEQVEAYDNDPYCGFSCSLLMWQDFLSGMLSIHPSQWPESLPIHLLSGGHDPVGEMGQGISRLADKIKGSGKMLVTFKLYEEARHELTNEINSDEVWQDIQTLVSEGQLAGA